MTELSEAPVDSGPEGEGTDPRRIAVFGVAGVVVLALLAWLLLGQGGSSEDDLTVAPPTKRVVKDVAALKVKPAALLPPRSQATLGRDPFKALITATVAAPAAPATGSGTTGGTIGGTVGTPSTGTGTATPTTTKAPQPTTYALRLSRVEGTGSNLIARFLIGNKGTVQYAKVGSRFGRTAEIKLLSLQSDGNGQGTAVIQVGESPFDVSTGDPAIFVQ